MKPLIIIGDGGHAEVLIDMAMRCGRKILGVTSLNKSVNSMVAGLPVLGRDAILANYSQHEVELINGIGSADLPLLRASIFASLKEKEYKFATLIHPSAILSSSVVIGEGAQILAGAILQTGSHIGINTIINSGAIVEHHGKIGDNCHLAPRVVCSGGVTVGNKCHIGVGAILIQGITLEDEVLVAAGAVVIKNISSRQRVKGVPAHPF